MNRQLVAISISAALVGITGTIAGQYAYDAARMRWVQADLNKMHYDAKHGLNGCREYATGMLGVGCFGANYRPGTERPWSMYWWEVPRDRFSR